MFHNYLLIRNFYNVFLAHEKSSCPPYQLKTQVCTYDMQVFTLLPIQPRFLAFGHHVCRPYGKVVENIWFHTGPGWYSAFTSKLESTKTVVTGVDLSWPEMGVGCCLHCRFTVTLSPFSHHFASSIYHFLTFLLSSIYRFLTFLLPVFTVFSPFCCCGPLCETALAGTCWQPQATA